MFGLSATGSLPLLTNETMDIQSHTRTLTSTDSSEAFVLTVVASVYDRSGIPDSLKRELFLLLSKKKYLQHLHLEELIDLSFILCRDLGKREVIEQSVAFLSEEMKAYLYAICLDMILINGHFDESELNFMLDLGRSLGIGMEESIRMIDLLCIKNYGNRYDD